MSAISKRIVFFMALFGTINLSIPISYAKEESSKCPLENRTYTDGRYELRFSKRQLPTEFYLKIVDPQTHREFTGEIIYNMGYSIPNVIIQIKSCEDRQENLDATCNHSYEGTVYEIEGEKTNYGFGNNENYRNPLLFPKLGYQFYSYRFDIFSHNEETPKDVWLFKECVSR